MCGDTICPLNTTSECNRMSPEEDPYPTDAQSEGLSPVLVPSLPRATSSDNQTLPGPSLGSPKPSHPLLLLHHIQGHHYIFKRLITPSFCLRKLNKGTGRLAGGDTGWPVSWPPSVFLPLAAKKRDSAVPTTCEKLPPASCFMKENLLGRAAKRSQPPAGCFRRARWRMRGHGGPAGLGGEWGDGDGGCWVCESCCQVVLEDETSWSLPCPGGQSLLCLCCLERGSFSVGLGMLSSVCSPQ